MVAAVGGLCRQQSIPRNTGNRRHLKGGQFMRSLKTILGTTALLAGLAFAPAAPAQVMVSIGAPPVCAYGYYDYAPYACTPMGFYGPGYFYNGIFLGMGPWAGYGYSHGWGGHRFSDGGGGSYRGGGGAMANRSNYARGSAGMQHANAAGGVHASAAHVSATHSSSAVHSSTNAGGARPSASHAAAPSHSSGGGAAHGGGGGHAGGGGGGGKH